MFGKNVIEKQEKNDDGLCLAVNSVFATIQGEGPWAGVPSIFIRLAGCNLRCVYCDTEFESRTAMLLGDLVTEVERIAVADGMQCAQKARPAVIITGGEPFRQNIVPLIYALLQVGHDVQIETAGTLWPVLFSKENVSLEWLLSAYGEDRLHIVVSPKTPKVHKLIRKHASAWKYIIRAGEVSDIDGLPTMSPQAGTPVNAILARPPQYIFDTNRSCIYVQPCDEALVSSTTTNIAESVRIAKKFGYSLSLQLHKILGLP